MWYVVCSGKSRGESRLDWLCFYCNIGCGLRWMGSWRGWWLGCSGKNRGENSGGRWGGGLDLGIVVAKYREVG